MIDLICPGAVGVATDSHRAGADGCREGRIVEHTVDLLSGDAVKVKFVVRLGQDGCGGLLLLRCQVKPDTGHGGHLQITIADHGLKQVIFPGRSLNVDITCHIIRVIGVGGGVASVLSDGKIHVFVGPVALATFLRQAVRVHGGEQDLGHGGIDHGHQGGGDPHIPGGDGGVLRDHAGGAVIVHHGVPVDAVKGHEVLGIRGGNALPLCLQKCFASHISNLPISQN